MKYVILMLLLSVNCMVYGQTLGNKNIIISTLVPDNLNGRYNFGMEYFLKSKINNSDNSKVSIALNGGLFSTNQLQKSFEGYSFIFETNLYTDFVLPKNWNEFGGLKISYGNLENKIEKKSNPSYFIGLSTGVQPVIAKIVTLKFYSDIGYFKNNMANTLLFDNSNELLYSGFTVNFNLGIGIRF